VILFLDNDIIAKAGYFDLIPECLELFHVGMESVRVLSSAQYRLHIAKNPQRGIQLYGQDGFDRLKLFFETAAVVESEPNQDIEALLSDVVGIDKGEAALVAAIYDTADTILLTGDKRFLRTLAATPRLKPIVDRLSGRFVYLEQIVLAIIDAKGYQHVVGKIGGREQFDQRLASIFGRGSDTPEDQARAAFASFMKEERGAFGVLLREL
jgi:hypothetical protein